MLRDHKWLTEWVSKRPAQKQRPWRTNLDRYLSHKADRYGRDTCCFNGPLNQSDGLIT